MTWRETTIGAFLDALAAPGPAPAAGVAAAAACGVAAALAELAEGAGRPRAELAATLREAALDLMERDSAGYAQLARALRDPHASAATLAAARESASRTPLAIAETGLQIAALAREVERQAPVARRPDAMAAAELARAACLAAVRIVEANLEPAGERPQLARARELRTSANAA
jgi:formiminotetrahydrofolate cyclodeaminase